MPKHQTIDLPKLPSFDVSNASSSITDQFIYGDRGLVKSRPKRNHSNDPYTMEFSRSSLQNVIHIITAELKSKGAKTPFVFLPFRQDDDEYKLKQFLTRIINDSDFIDEKMLETVVKRTDEYTLISSLKFFWCRLPSNAIIGWKSYNKFAKLEKEKGYPKKAFLTIMPYCLSSASHASIVYDFLDLLVSVASYTKDNKLSGRKICKMCGIWAFNGSQSKSSSKQKKMSFAKGLNDWIPASDALFHIMLSFLRSILPDDETNQKQLPKTLQSLISSSSYPPPETKHSDPSSFLEVPIITLCVNSPSRSPLELIYKIGKTLTFDNAKLFYSRDDYILLKSLFKDSHALIDRLSSENKKIIDRISSTDSSDLIVDEEYMKFKLVPGWSDDLISFNDQEEVPASQHFYTANVSKTLIDDYFIWTWLSTLGSEETSAKRKIFGKTFILEVELSESYKKWVIIEEQDISNEVFDNEVETSDMDIELKLQNLRRQEAELLEQKLKKKKKNGKADSPAPAPAPISKEVPLPPVPSSKSKKLKKLDESSKKFSGKLASSIRKFSNSEPKRAVPETKPLPVAKDNYAVPQDRGVNQIPRDLSEHNFKLPEFEDDNDDLADDLADDFAKYLKTSTISETKPLNVRARTPSPQRSPKNVETNPVEPLNSPSGQGASPAQYANVTHMQNHRAQMVSVYGLEQLQQYSPYINYDDGQFPSLSPQRSSFHEQDKRYSRSPEIHQEPTQKSPQFQRSPQHSPIRQQKEQSPQRQQAQYQYDQRQSDQQQYESQTYHDLNIPSDQTSGSSSRLKRKPPPPTENLDVRQTALERPHSQYSDNPITPSNSAPALRPLSAYSNNSYANSFAPPTPQHQLLGSQQPHLSPEKSLDNNQYQYRTAVPHHPSDYQQQVPPQQNMVQQTASYNSPPVQYQYKSMLSPVGPQFEDKPLPPSPEHSYPSETVYGSPMSHPRYSAVASPPKGAVQSPTKSMNEQNTMYGSAPASPYHQDSSPVRSHASPRGSPSRDQIGNGHYAQMDKSLPASPVKSVASTQLPSPSKSLYGSSASPTKVSLYGESATDLSEEPKRESAFHDANDTVENLAKPSPLSKPTRASAIIENFDALENELQNFLNEDSKSVDSAESFKTGREGSESFSRPASMTNPPVAPQQSQGLSYPASQQNGYHQQHPEQASRNQPPISNGQQYQQGQVQQHATYPPPHRGSQDQRDGLPSDPRYPPDTSNPSVRSQVPSNSPEMRQEMQPYSKSYPSKQHMPGAPGQYPQGQQPQGHYSPSQHPQGQQPQGQYSPGQRPQAQQPQGQYSPGQHPQGQHPQGQYSPGQHPQGQHPQGQYSPGQHPQVPHPQGAYPRKPVQQVPQQLHVSPNSSYDQLHVPQNGHPVQQAAKEYPAPQMANAHSPARPSNLGPNYHHSPRQQQGAMPPYYGPAPQNYGPNASGHPPSRGRLPYAPGPYGPGPQQYQQYPGAPPKQQYYQQPYGSPRPDQYQQGQRTPHHAPSGTFGTMASPPQAMYNGGGLSPNHQQTRTDYAIQQMPPAQKMNKLHGHTGDRNTKKNLRDAIVTGGFGI